MLATDHQPAGKLPGPVALKRMMAAMVELFCDSFDAVPRRIVLDIDDTEDRVHGGQQLALFNAYYDSRGFQLIHIYEATTMNLAITIDTSSTHGRGTMMCPVSRCIISIFARLGNGQEPRFRRVEGGRVRAIPRHTACSSSR